MDGVCALTYKVAKFELFWFNNEIKTACNCGGVSGPPGVGLEGVLVDGAPARGARWMGDVPVFIKSPSLNCFHFTTKSKLQATAADS